MGGRNYNMNSPQTFDLMKEDESFSRKGGCFVTTPKVIIYVIIALFSLIFVALIMYYYGPYSSVIKTVQTPMDDIEKLLNLSLENIPRDEKLGKDFQAKLYEIKLDPEESNFSGEISIRFVCLKKTKLITLNADKMEINSVKLAKIESNSFTRNKRNVDIDLGSNSSKEIGVNATENSANLNTTETSTNSTNNEKTFITTETPITTTTTLKPIQNDYVENIEGISNSIELNISEHYLDLNGSKFVIKLKKDLEIHKEYILNVTFSSNTSDAFQGLHRLKYVNESSILATQFQPIYARKVFPCFDEPSFKCPVKLRISKRDNLTTLTNTPLLKTYDSDGKRWDEFQLTPSIPTYLISFVMGNFHQIQFDSKTAPIITVWGMKNSTVDVNYIVDFTRNTIGFFEKYLGVSYPMNKIDIVAIRKLRISTSSPGLILIKESLLLDQNRQELFSILRQSLTKEWIGNLVSIDWWDDYWMIKSFSIFLSEELQKERTNHNSDFTLKITQETLQSDDLKSALSLKSNIQNKIQIIDISDKMKANKGSCILRMINASLAPLTFQKGIQSFLKKWEGNSTNVEELWKSLDLVITQVDRLPEGLNLSEIMKSWTTQASYPLVTVRRNLTNNGLDINQSKFTLNSNETESDLWTIPVKFMVGNNEDIETKEIWLTEKTTQINNITGDIKNKFVLFNLGFTGYYRVNYGLDNWNLLANTLYSNHLIIPLENRGQLINDAFDLSESGLLDYQVPFNLSRYLINETQYIPWASAIKSLEFIRSILETTYLNGAYEDYITKLIGNVYDRISAEEVRDENGEKLRSLVVETACSVNYANCTKWALERFREFMNNSNAKFSNRRTALCTAIRQSGRKEWESIYEKLSREDDQPEIDDLYYCLGCTKHLWLINKYLDSTLNGTIPSRHVPLVWQSLHQIPSRNFAFKFLRQNWERIHEVYGEKRLILKAILSEFLETLSTETDKEDLTLFFGKYKKDLQGFSYLLKGVVDRIDSRILWAEKHIQTIDVWLSSSHEYNK